MDDLYQDFDKEALWSRIESKKRKRKPIFWWVFGFGVFAVVVGIVFYTIDNANNTPITNQKHIAATQNHQTTTEDSCSTSLETSNELVQISKMTGSQSSNTITESKSLTNAAPKSDIHSNITTVAENKKNDQKTLVSKHYVNKNK